MGLSSLTILADVLFAPEGWEMPTLKGGDREFDNQTTVSRIARKICSGYPALYKSNHNLV